MIVLIPSVLVFYCMKARDRALVSVAAAGMVSGLFVCVCTALFTFLHRIPEYSFGSNFAYYAAREYILPLAVLYALFFFVSRDSFSFKIKAFFPLSAGFLSVFMPYMTIASNGSVFSFYEIFAKPAIWLSMVVTTSFLVTRLSHANMEKKNGLIAVYSVLLAFTIFIPPFLNALWITNWLRGLFVVAGTLYILEALALGLFAILRPLPEDGASL